MRRHCSEISMAPDFEMLGKEQVPTNACTQITIIAPGFQTNSHIIDLMERTKNRVNAFNEDRRALQFQAKHAMGFRDTCIY